MKACCPICDRLCSCAQRELKPNSTRQRNTYVEPHKQPTCPTCLQLATFVTDDDPRVSATLVHGTGYFTCMNRHHFAEPIDGRACTGHKKPI